MRFTTYHPRYALGMLILLAALSSIITSCGGISPSMLTVVSAEATSKTSVLVTFSEAVGDGAEVVNNYTIARSDGTQLEVLAAYLNANKATVTLATGVQNEGETYVLTASNIKAAADSRVISTVSTTGSFGGSGVSAPITASAIALSNTQVLVTFAHPSNGTPAVMGSSATIPAYYVIANPKLTVSSVTQVSGGTAVILTTSSQEDLEYSVKVTNVTTKTGNRLIDPFNAVVSFTGIAPIDSTAPRVVSGTALSSATVLVSFSEPVNAQASDASNYVITDTHAQPLVVISASLNEFGTQAVLTTASQTEGAAYTLSVSGVADRAGNLIDADAHTANFTGKGVSNDSTSPPRIANAGSTGNTMVLVTFSKPMQAGSDSTENPAHYQIYAEQAEGLVAPQSVLNIIAAEQINSTTVQLTTGSQSGITYTLKVTNVRDLYGNQLQAPVLGSPDPSMTTFRGTAPTGSELTDTDGDGLTDSEELRGWTVSVGLANGRTTTRTVTSDPYTPDTDGDRIFDFDEKNYLTDPRDADTDDDNLTDYQELNLIYSDPAHQDTDGDSLADGLEFNFFKTSPLLEDTDGDQLSDDTEILQINRNPRSSDLPRHNISIGEVDIRLNIAYSLETSTSKRSGGERTSQVNLSQSNSRELSTSDTTTTEWYARAGVEAKASASYPGGFSAEATFTAEAGVGASGTFVQNETTRRASQQEYLNSLQSVEAVEEGETVVRTVTGASMFVPLYIENAGDISFTMTDIEITALIANPAKPTTFIPVATLLAAPGTATTYNLGTIDTRLGPFRFGTSPEDINPDLIDTLMRNPQGIIFRVSNFNITDEFGNNFSFQQQDVTERTAPVVIDFGNGVVERYWSAIGTGRRIDTNGDNQIDDSDGIAIFDADGKPVGVTLVQVLEEVIGLEHVDLDTQTDYGTSDARRQNSYATRTVGGARTLVRIRRTVTDTNRNAAWNVLTRQGVDSGLSIDDIILSRGNGVTLAFIVDEDGDRVPNRIEYLYNSLDTLQDTDSDGVGDFDEIYEGYEVNVVGELAYLVYSSPAVADTDGDGLSDYAERNAAMGDGTGPTDPKEVDTDSDGACDGPSVAGCPLDLYPLDPARSGRPPLLAEYLFSGNVNDTSTNGKHGSASSACTELSADRFGIVNRAYRFNTGASCLNHEVGYLTLPHLTISQEFSVAAWVYPEANDNFAWIAGQTGDRPWNTAWARLFIGSDLYSDTAIGANQKVSFAIRGATSSDTIVVTDPATVPLNQWSFYVATVGTNGTSTTVRLYRDGIKVAEATRSVVYTNPSSTDPFLVASAESSNYNLGFKGKIDDLRIYNGILSGVNVLELYEEGGYTP